MKFSGYDAILIHGHAQVPTYLSIQPHKIEFKNAEALRGLSAEETGRLLSQMEEDAGIDLGIMSNIRIGQAGERLIRYASVVVDTYRHFGRLGMGAVMGSKNLKGIVVHGNQFYPIKENKKEYQKLYRDLYKRITETEVMEKYHTLGTPANILSLNAMKALPTRNLQQAQFEEAENISGENFAKITLIRKIACSGCPIGCIHLGLHRRQFSDGYDFESTVLSYDYELIFALGSFLGLSDPNDIYALIERVELHGLDAMSTGVILGWIAEAYEKKLISEKETETPVAFGEKDGFLKIISGIVEQSNEFYKTLASGSYAAAQKYGGVDFAMNYCKNEMAGYHTGYANLLGMAVGARHSHLDNAGYSIDQGLSEFDKEKIVDMLLEEEKERNVLNCLVICLFSRKIYDMKTVSECLNAVGISMSVEDLKTLGEKIFNLKVAIKKKMGFNYKKITFPKRFFETECLNGKLHEQMAHELLDLYIEKAGI